MCTLRCMLSRNALTSTNVSVTEIPKASIGRLQPRDSDSGSGSGSQPFVTSGLLLVVKLCWEPPSQNTSLHILLTKKNWQFGNKWATFFNCCPWTRGENKTWQKQEKNKWGCIQGHIIFWPHTLELSLKQQHWCYFASKTDPFCHFFLSKGTFAPKGTLVSELHCLSGCQPMHCDFWLPT